MLSKLLSASGNINAEHLLSFPQKDYLTCTKSFVAVAPLLQHTNYNVLYNDSLIQDSESLFFDNVVPVKSSWQSEDHNMQQYFVISFLSKGLSQCASFDNEHLFRFFLENYQNHRSNFKNALRVEMNVADLNEFLMAKESEHNEVILKPDPCHHKIPVHIYTRIMERIPVEYKQLLHIDTPERVERIQMTLESRYNSTCRKGNFNIMTKPGLLKFAKSGILSEHLEGLPPRIIE